MRDKEKQRVYNQKYRKDHPEKAQSPEYAKEYRKSHPEVLKRARVKYERSLPPLVYRWEYPDGRVAYVGRGTIHRAKSHRTKSSWFVPEMLLIVEECRNEWHAMQMEGIWGEQYNPLFNKEGYRYDGRGRKSQCL